ncbi:MAG TPA: hypothetical protein VHJ18_31810 [Streptosporangiaceae bacterium]|jgi:hypothetical protein|nr:hypothetical protein [Streptosporangiaceae bacterium]
MIRAGRGDDGQPHPDPAKPDTGQSGDPSSAGEHAGSPQGAQQADPPAQAGQAAPSSTVLTEDEPVGAGTANATKTDAATEDTADAQAESPAGPSAGGGRWGVVRRALGHNWVRHLILILVYQGAGIAATWPRFTWLAAGKMPATSDVSSYVWDLWWVEHSLIHLHNPLFTAYWAAPVGTHLAFSTLMPLAGWIMAPITALYGPSASFSLLTIVTPGLLCYAMYRAAKLWLNEPGAIVAGAFFGLASMLLWQNWYHVNIAIGTIFLPVTIEAAVRFRRNPTIASAVILGIALGGSILINQESTVVAVLLAIFILIPWLVGAVIRNRELFRRAIKPLSVGALVGFVVGLPELIAMLQQIIAGGADPPIGQLSMYYAQFGVSLPTLFSPSPRLAHFGLGHLTSSYSYHNSQQVLEGLPTFGAVLTAAALLGIVVGWRKRSTWAWVGLWLVSAALALGTSLTIGRNCVISAGIYHRPGKVYGHFCTQYLPLMSHMAATKVVYKGGPVGGVWKPVVVSDVMPYTWLVRIPGLSGLREADRFALVGLIGAAMLAGLTVQFLSRRRILWPLIAVIVGLGALEAGWSGASPTSPGYPSNFGYHGTMLSAVPGLDRQLIADHSKSIVVDVPFGLRGGVGVTGQPISPNALLIATHDEHRRAIAYTAWVSKLTNKGIANHAFYRYLYVAQKAGGLYPTRLAAARADLKTLHVGWVIEWRNVWTDHHQWQRYRRLTKYLENVGFRKAGDSCVVGHDLGSAACPSGHHVWLFKYEPGTPKDPLEG